MNIDQGHNILYSWGGAPRDGTPLFIDLGHAINLAAGERVWARAAEGRLPDAYPVGPRARAFGPERHVQEFLKALLAKAPHEYWRRACPAGSLIEPARDAARDAAQDPAPPGSLARLLAPGPCASPARRLAAAALGPLLPAPGTWLAHVLGPLSGLLGQLEELVDGGGPGAALAPGRAEDL